MQSVEIQGQKMKEPFRNVVLPLSTMFFDLGPQHIGEGDFFSSVNWVKYQSLEISLGMQRDGILPKYLGIP